MIIVSYGCNLNINVIVSSIEPKLTIRLPFHLGYAPLADCKGGAQLSTFPFRENEELYQRITHGRN